MTRCKFLMSIIAFLFHVNALANQEPTKSEYAIRWKSTEPLANIDDVVKILRVEGILKITNFKIEYFKISLDEKDTQKIPQNSTVIARIRTEISDSGEEGETTRTVKYRTATQPLIKLDSRNCPSDYSGDDEWKYETDISFGNSLKTKNLTLSAALMQRKNSQTA